MKVGRTLLAVGGAAIVAGSWIALNFPRKALDRDLFQAGGSPAVARTNAPRVQPTPPPPNAAVDPARIYPTRPDLLFPFPAEEWDADAASLNRAVDCLNAVSRRAADSFHRYKSWVGNIATGPTGKERVKYGLYTLVRNDTCTANLSMVRTARPDVAAAVGALAGALPALDRLTTQADGYYRTQTWRDDGFTQGKALHQPLLQAFQATSDADAALRRALVAARAQKQATPPPAPPSGPLGSIVVQRDRILAAAAEVFAASRAEDAAALARALARLGQEQAELRRLERVGQFFDDVPFWLGFRDQAQHFADAAAQRLEALKVGDGKRPGVLFGHKQLTTHAESLLANGRGCRPPNVRPADEL